MLSLDKIQSHLLYKFESRDELIKSIETLWHNFTSDRSKINEYLKDEKLASAYTAFYLLTNYQKLEALFNYAGINPEVFEDYNVFDIGCGPGTYLVAFNELCFGHDEKLFGIESSEVMRSQATKLTSGLGIKKAKIVSSINEIPEGKKLAIFGHSINEMRTDRAMKYIDKIAADVVLVLEPGTKESFTELLQLRKQMLKKGYHCLYPCPNNDECPMRNTEDWCHQYMKIEMDLKTSNLSHGLNLDRGLQAISAFIYAKDENFMQRASKRFVRYYRQTKHSFDWQICHHEDGVNKLQNLEVTKKNLSKTQIKDVEQTYPGQAVEYDYVKDLPDSIRVELKL